MPQTTAPAIESDALRANLQETAVDEVTIAPEQQVLAEIAKEYKGIHHTISDLLHEINHPFRNWSLILPKLRAFILKHNQLYVRHQRSPEAFSQMIAIHLTAIRQAWENQKIKKAAPALSHGATTLSTDGKSPKNWDAIIALAMESLLAYLEKFINDLNAETLTHNQQALNHGVEVIAELDDQALILMVQGYHPINKIAAALLRVSDGTTFDLAPFAQLYNRLLAIDYRYWLGEEDPLPWFTAACGHKDNDWDVAGLFASISHATMQAHLKALDQESQAEIPPAEQLRHLLTLPTHLEIVRVYKDIPAKLLTIPFPNASYPGAGDRPLPATAEAGEAMDNREPALWASCSAFSAV